MIVTSSLKKCPKCRIFSTDCDVCEHCGELLSFQKKQELREQDMREAQVAQLNEELENPNFVERMKTHRYSLVRFFGYLLYLSGVIVSIIAAGLAWLITMVMGG